MCISSKFPNDADGAGLSTALRTTGVVYRNGFLESVSWIQILAPLLRVGEDHLVSELLIAHLYLPHRREARMT